LYGSARLGMYLPEKLVTSVSTDSKQREVGYLGKQIFELSNHLGNVLATITDKKLQVSLNSSSTAYFEADVQTVQDYYAFGMQMPGRKLSGGYRYGFGGQEHSEQNAQGIYTAEWWEYDSRIGRRWNVDPIYKEFESPYVSFGDNPILIIDPNGDDGTPVTPKKSDYFLDKDGNIVTQILSEVVVTSIRKKSTASTPKKNGISQYKMTIEGSGIFSYSHNGGSYVYFKAKMALDLDGSLRAYHPNNKGLELNANGGIPGKEYGIAHDKNGNAILQGPSDPYPGYYISTTSLQSSYRSPVLQNVNSEEVAYIALPPSLKAMGVKLGDISYVYDAKKGIGVFAIFADVGPRNKIGEGSMNLLNRLGHPVKINKKGRAIGGVDGKDLEYFIFPNSGDKKPHSNGEIEKIGKQFFEKLLSLFKFNNKKNIYEYSEDIIVVISIGS